MSEIAELFDRDPLDLSDQDIDAIVAKLREDAKAWAKLEAEGKTRKRSSEPVQGNTDDLLKDLGL